MLVHTSNALPSGDGPPAECDWTGPRVLLVRPGARCSRERIEEFTQSQIVVELLEEPPAASVLLGALVEQLVRVMNRADWPLLFVDRPTDAAEIALHGELARQDVWDVVSEFAADGRLVLLRLGEMVATSPLLMPLLSLLAARRVDDSVLAAVIAETFAPDRA